MKKDYDDNVSKILEYMRLDRELIIDKVSEYIDDVEEFISFTGSNSIDASGAFLRDKGYADDIVKQHFICAITSMTRRIGIEHLRGLMDDEKFVFIMMPIFEGWLLKALFDIDIENENITA